MDHKRRSFIFMLIGFILGGFVIKSLKHDIEQEENAAGRKPKSEPPKRKPL